jgi:ABC-type lipoprotein export system ATPase subunit
MSDGFLHVKAMTKCYTGPSGQTEVLKGINLDIQKGRTCAIVGPSGCGKSTLLNIIGLLDKPTNGSLFLEGQDMSRLSDQAVAKVRSTQIGFVFQMHHLLPQCSVLDNVLLPTLAGHNKTPRKELLYYAADLLERVGLTGKMSYRPGQLSAGQRQRAAIVRALINKPSLLLADEPTGSLDHANAEQIAELLVELNHQEKVTLIIATHAGQLAAKMERRFDLSDGVLREMSL